MTTGRINQVDDNGTFSYTSRMTKRNVLVLLIIKIMSYTLTVIIKLLFSLFVAFSKPFK